MERPDHGLPVELEPGVRLVLAPNPSPMTHWGTNTYLVGTDDLAVIDPGPDDPAHLSALMRAIGGARVSAILVTHAHRDHSPLAAPLAHETNAPVLAYGAPGDGRSPVMERLAREGGVGGSEGVDEDFRPDRRIAEGDAISLGRLGLEVLHTPGHFPGHLSFALGDAVFSGDHVLGWASTFISPPDGDVAAFMATSRRLRDRGARVFYPGHGAPVRDPEGTLDWLVAHRREREASILAAIQETPLSTAEIAARVYTDTDPRMLPAAKRNVLAHLVDLVEKGRVTAMPSLGSEARFSRTAGA